MPSSETVVPRERQSAWQRWELAALGAAPSRAESEAAAADLLARERAVAQAEGRAAGYAQGRAEAAEEQRRLAALVASLSHSLAEHEQHLVDEVLDLAVVLARHMVGEALTARRELVLPVLAAALRELPQATQRITVAVHPADLPVVQSFIGTEPLAERCRFSPDPGVSPGGCRIETEQCAIDATVGARWKRLLAALGRTGDWLEPA